MPPTVQYVLIFPPNHSKCWQGVPVPTEFGDKRVSNFLRPQTANPPTQIPAASSMLVLSMVSTSSILASTAQPITNPMYCLRPQGTANIILQAMPCIQQMVTIHCINQPKALTSFSPPTVGLTCTKHFSILHQQQGKLTRDGSLRL